MLTGIYEIKSIPSFPTDAVRSLLLDVDLCKTWDIIINFHSGCFLWVTDWSTETKIALLRRANSTTKNPPRNTVLIRVTSYVNDLIVFINAAYFLGRVLTFALWDRALK